MALRGYQEDTLDRARARLRAGVRRLLLQLPTGGGKTVIAAEMLGGASKRGLTSWFIVHRKELLKQTGETFTAAGLRVGYIAAGLPEDPTAPIQLCGQQTLVNRLADLAPPDFVVPDEAHHCVADGWARIMGHCATSKIVGLTATPERLDGRGLGDHFDDIVVGPSVKQLIADGWLSPYRYFAPGQPDLVGCRTVGGDFNRGDIAEIMGDAALIGDMVAHYQSLAPGKQGIVFAVDRKHSAAIADAFNAAGISASHVDGAMTSKTRDAAVDAFRAGSTTILTNCELFGEGFDVPGIAYVGLARPTQSLALHLQQVGRALRVMEGKDEAIVCDHAGNAFRHGMPDDERQWSLEGRKKRSRAAGPSDAFPIRQCVECYQVSPSSAEHCPGCGVVFPERARPASFEKGELFELERIASKARAAQQRKQEERACQSIGDFYKLGVARGYENPRGWAYRQVQQRQSYGQRFRKAG